MPQSLTRIYLHIVFSTKHREATIDDTIKEDLHSYIGALCRERDCQPVQIGGYTDHVHILCTLSRKITVMKLLEELKSTPAVGSNQRETTMQPSTGRMVTLLSQ